jgi:hypothetical protein
MSGSFCTHCGAPRAEGAPYCTACGAKVAAEGAQPAQQPPQQAQQQQPQPPPQQAQGQQQYQQPGYQQQPYPGQYPGYGYQQPAPPKKRGAGKTIAIIAGILVGLGALCFGGLVVIGLLNPDSPPGGGGTPGGGATDSTVAWQPTYDQMRVLDEFGPPQGFTLAYGEDATEDLSTVSGELPIHRAEAWDYFDMQTRFLFKDGEAIGTEDLPPPPSNPYYPQFNPLDFVYGMSAEQVNDFIGIEPSMETQPDPAIFPDLKVTNYYNQLFVTYEDGALVGVEAPVLADQGGAQ